jgi:hypothetical protein
MSISKYAVVLVFIGFGCSGSARPSAYPKTPVVEEQDDDEVADDRREAMRYARKPRKTQEEVDAYIYANDPSARAALSEAGWQRINQLKNQAPAYGIGISPSGRAGTSASSPSPSPRTTPPMKYERTPSPCTSRTRISTCAKQM